MSEVLDKPASLAPTEGAKMVIPAYKGIKAIELDISSTRASESRFHEVKIVNPSTYVDLEHSFNESYRELKRHSATIGYQITMAEKALEQVKAEIVLDKYPTYMAGKPKSSDNADMRKAFMMRDQEYLEALDRIAMLRAMESWVDGRTKVIENVARYMRKQMDLIVRSGLSANYYNTQGNR